MTTERYPASPRKPGNRAIMAGMVCVIIAASALSFEGAMYLGAGGSVAPLFRPPVIVMTLVALALVVAAVALVTAGGVQVYRVVGSRPDWASPVVDMAPAPDLDQPTDPWAAGAQFAPATYGSPAAEPVSAGP